MNAKPSGLSAERAPEEAPSDWWSTAIIDIEPGKIAVRGYPIEELIGALSFPRDGLADAARRGARRRAQARLLEAALVAAVDHGPHAPSIAISRMAVTCGLPLNGAMASAINALDDVHGGAGQQCMELYRGDRRRPPASGEASADASQRRARCASSAAHGKIIPGFGHRWHGVDPRAVRLLALVARPSRPASSAAASRASAGCIERRSTRAQGQRRSR